MGILRVGIWVIGVINLLTKSPGPSKKGSTLRGCAASTLTRFQGQGFRVRIWNLIWASALGF